MKKNFLIFFALACLFCFSMFYRSSNAVIAIDLINDLKLNVETIGFLGGAFFYSFSLMQIPMGPLLDRIGPKYIMSFCAFIGAIGSFIFASSASFSSALVGRILIGIGMAPMLMGSLKVFILRFPSEHFATLAGLIITAGAMGNLLSASPFAYVCKIIGWRSSFVLTGILTVIFGFFIYALLNEKKNNPQSMERKKNDNYKEKKGYVKDILKAHTFWQICVVAFFRYGTFISLQGLWLGVYLMSVKGYSSLQTGNLLILLAIGNALGAPFSGRISDAFSISRKKMVLVGLGVYTSLILVLSIISHFQNPVWYGVIYFFLGFFNGFGTLLYSHVKEFFPVELSATTMAWVNFFSMIGGALIMSFLGIIINYLNLMKLELNITYRITFFLCFLMMSLSLIYYSFSRAKRE